MSDDQPPRKVRKNYYLSEPLAKQVQEEAEWRGLNESTIVTLALEMYFNSPDHLRVGKRKDG